MEKLFEKLPYDFLGGVKYVHYILASAGVGMILFAVYYFSLYQTTHEELVQLETKRTQTQQKLNNYKQLVSQKETIAKELARSTGNLEAMKRQLPKEQDMPDLLKQVADFGGGRGRFDVLRFQLQEGNVKDYYKELPVTIQMRGSFWDTLDFMDKMQNLMQLVHFSDLQMVQTGAGASSGNSEEAALVSAGSRGGLHTNLVASTYAFVDGAENRVPGAPGNAGN